MRHRASTRQRPSTLREREKCEVRDLHVKSIAEEKEAEPGITQGS